MNLAPLTTRRRQHVWSPDPSPSSSPLTTSAAVAAAALCDDDVGFLPHGAYSASVPAPLDLSYCDPSSDDFFVDSRQSTPYDNSTFDPSDLQFMTDGTAPNPRLYIQPSTSHGLPETYTPPPMNAGSYQSQAWNNGNSNSSGGVPNWPQLASNSSQHHRKIAFRTHKRLSSGSSTGSVGPDSPFTQTSDYPQIVDTDTVSANSPHHLDTYETLFSNTEQFAKPLAAQSSPLNDGSLFSPVYSVNPPTDHAAQFIAAHTAMSQGQRGRGQRRRNLHTGDAFADGASMQGEYAMSSEVGSSSGGSTIPGLARNISEVYQDELYNPHLAGPTQSPSASQAHLNASQTADQSPRQSQGQGSTANSHLSPTYRTTFTDRRQAADAARSTSPASSLVRERSPFRADSEYAGASDFSQGPNSPARINSAAQIRAQQKFDADAQAFAQHHPQIAAQDFAVTPSTVSPKDTYREYHDSEDESKNFALFPQQNLHLPQETIFPPTTVPTARRPTASAGLGAPYGARSDIVDFSTPTSNPADFSFMASSMSSLPPQYPFISQSRRPSSGMRNLHHSDTMPEFPATLSSMESTKSEASPGEIVRPAGFEPQSQPSSQDETSTSTSPPQRPTDTSANSGTYTCTAPSCSARFDSSLKLHKHRRDFHRASSPGTSVAASTPNPTTPSSVASGATNAGASSTSQQNAQAAANNVSRNNLPGPHKCERINPSTGKPCNTNFSRSYDLTRHEETIHSNRKQKVRCQLCTEAKTFSRNDALTRHMRVVHPDVEFSGKSGRRGRH